MKTKRHAMEAIRVFDGELLPWTKLSFQSTLNAWWCAFCAMEQYQHFPGVYPCQFSPWWDYRLKPASYRLIWRVYDDKA